MESGDSLLIKRRPWLFASVFLAQRICLSVVQSHPQIGVQRVDDLFVSVNRFVFAALHRSPRSNNRASLSPYFASVVHRPPHPLWIPNALEHSTTSPMPGSYTIQPQPGFFPMSKLRVDFFEPVLNGHTDVMDAPLYGVP